MTNTLILTSKNIIFRRMEDSNLYIQIATRHFHPRLRMLNTCRVDAHKYFIIFFYSAIRLALESTIRARILMTAADFVEADI